VIKVLPIKKEECTEWFLQKHYAKRMPSFSVVFGLYVGDILSGVCSFGKPMSHTLVKGAFNGLYQDCFLELNRLVVNDGLPRNTLSFFVSRCLKNLTKPHVVVSYADTAQSHTGYIYQATNWLYTGLSSRFKDYAVEGLEHLHHASIGDSVGRYDKTQGINKHELLLQKYGDRLYLKERPQKHRYFHILGTKKQKKVMIKNLSYEILPYPKGENKRYDCSHNPPVQKLLFSEQ